MNKKRLLSWLLAVILAFSCIGMSFAEGAGTTEITNLKVNFQTNPLGIEKEDIRFSWSMASNIIGQGQKAYQIVVTRDAADGEIVWDSGIVEGALSTGVMCDVVFDLETRYYWTVQVTDLSGAVIKSEPAYFETGANWDGISWIVPSNDPGAGNTYAVENPDDPEEPIRKGGAPLLRMEDTLKGEVSNARLYITGLGIYDAYINGEKILTADNNGNQMEAVMAPGWTDYNFYTNYQTYDVTEELAKAENGEYALGVAMYRGWYAGLISEWGRLKYENLGVTGAGESTHESEQLALIAKLVIEYADGTTEVIATDAENWKSIAGPVTSNDIYRGEAYDARIAKNLQGWNTVGFADDNWFEVAEFNGYSGELRGSSAALARIAEEMEITPVRAYTYKESETIYPEVMPPEAGEFTPGENDWYGEVVEHPVDVNGEVALNPDDILIVDMGQNMVGVTEFKVSGPEGATIHMRHMEMLNDGKLNPNFPAEEAGSDGPRGSLHYSSLRDPRNQNTYYTLSDEAEQTYCPASIYMGYQFMEFTTDQPVTISGIRGRVITSITESTGELETSDELVNKLISNIRWSQIDNFTTIPTDCPQRDERQGWTGDAQLFTESGVYSFDTIAFMDNFIAMLDAHCQNYGSFGSTVPGTSSGFNCGWTDIGVITPWQLYQKTGDIDFFARMYDTMDLYMDNVYKTGYDDIYFGDWIHFAGASTPYVNAVYQIYTTDLMVKMAELLERDDMVAKYVARAEELRTAFMAEPVIEERETSESNPRGMERVGGGFVYANGDLMSYAPVASPGYLPNMVDNAQTALLWALKLELYRDEEHKAYMIEKLIESIVNENRSINPGQPEGTLAVGFLGVNVLLPILSEVGANETAYNLLLQQEQPSWLYSVVNGATSIWERWNAYSTVNSFGPYGMNSFNHFSYGACIEWMYEYMSGINQVESVPGFKEITLQPTIDASGRIDFVNGSYDSVYGLIESSWTSENGKLATYKATVPANTTATLYLPVEASAVEGFEAVDGISFTGMEEHNGVECARFDVLSGAYSMTVADGKLSAQIADGYIAR